MRPDAVVSVFRMAAVNFWRNIWLSLASVLVMVMALIVVSVLGVMSVVGERAIATVEEKVDISVYLSTETTPEQVQQVEQRILAMPGVSSVNFVSQDEALARFRERHQGSELILESLTELDENPLQPSFTILAESATFYEGISDSLSGEAYTGVVDEVNFKDNKAVIDRLTAAISVVQRAGVAVALVFIGIAILLAFNTVRLAIYNRRTEIEIMQLVGASHWFIRTPFMLEGVTYGMIATLVNVAILYPVFVVLSPKLVSFFPSEAGGIDLLAYVQENFLWILALQLGFAVGVGVFSSAVAIRRYLRV